MKIKQDLLRQREVIENTLKTLNTAKKLLILFVTVLAIAGGFWYFIYQDNVAKIEQKKKEIEQAKNRLQQLKMAERKSKELEKQVAEAEAKLREMLVYLPDVKEIPSVLEKISQLGSKTGLKQLILFEPRGEELREFHAAIPIHLEMVGGYDNVGMFFDELSRTERVIKVKQFTMKRKGSGEINIDSIVETYRYVETPPEQPKGKKK
jgi:type IV pilus assembly protein PilO